MIEDLEKDFSDITGTRLDNVSQLKLFQLLKDEDGSVLFNLFNSYEMSDDISDRSFYEKYTINNEDWWENISFKFYGTPYLWWVILLVNKITNPFESLNAGDLIYILQPQYIYQLLKEIKSMGSI